MLFRKESRLEGFSRLYLLSSVNVLTSLKLTPPKIFVNRLAAAMTFELLIGGSSSYPWGYYKSNETIISTRLTFRVRLKNTN